MGLRLQQVDGNTSGNYVQSNEADDQLDQALTKTRSFVVTTADLDLTTGDEDDPNQNLYKALRSRRLVFTGAMTANRNVIVPNDEKEYICDMQCTGGFTLTVKTAGGTGVGLVNGNKKLLYSDGTNVINALS